MHSIAIRNPIQSIADFARKNKAFLISAGVLLAVLILFSANPVFASGGGVLDSGQAMDKGKQLFEDITKILGTFLIIIGSIFAVWGAYNYFLNLKDGISGNNSQNLMAIAGGVGAAVVGFLMRDSGTKLFDFGGN